MKPLVAPHTTRKMRRAEATYVTFEVKGDPQRVLSELQVRKDVVPLSYFPRTGRFEIGNALIARPFKGLTRRKAAQKELDTVFDVPVKDRNMGRPIPGLKGIYLDAIPHHMIVPALPQTDDLPPAIATDAFRPDARAQALLRGLRTAETDLRNAGGTFDLQQVQAILKGISRQRVAEMVDERALLAVPGPSNRRRYPTLQFQPDGTVIKGLKPVLEALPTRNPWMILNFLVQPDDRLNGRSPVAVLKAGNIDAVIDAARSLGQQGG